MAKSKDSIELAKDFFNEFLSKADPDSEPLPSERRSKAKAAGSLGGQKGGRARAANLTNRRKKQIARKGGKTRWL